MIDNTPIDYLDFASPISGLGSKMGLNATNKWPGETQREWGAPITMDDEVKARGVNHSRNAGLSFPINRHSGKQLCFSSMKCWILTNGASV